MSWYNSAANTISSRDSDNGRSTNSDSDDSNANGSDLHQDGVTDNDDVVDCVSAGRATDPSMKHELLRLDTFSKWPIDDIVSRQLLARDGFYYTGTADKVQCAFCNGVLCDWVKGDYPNVEHEKHFADCRFVRGQSVGNVPIATDPRRSVEPANSTSRAGNLRTVVVNNKRFNIEEREVVARLDSAVVKTIMAMGYEQRLVHDVLKCRLESHGTDFTDMMSFVRALNEATNKPTQSRSASKAAPLKNVSDELKAVSDKKIQSKIEGKANRKQKSKSKLKPTGSCSSAEALATKVGQTAAAEFEAKTMQEISTNSEVRTTAPQPSERPSTSASVSDRCQWCNTRVASMAFIPCGHTFLCSACSRSLNNCPHCGQAIDRQLRIYLS